MSVAMSVQPSGVAIRLVHDFQGGLHRVRAGRSFVYLDEDQAVVDDPVILDRIRGLAIPPAWTMVWIAPLANAHLQATGIDSRGRKQYRYHSL
jgi:DNA topoisomerase I